MKKLIALFFLFPVLVNGQTNIGKVLFYEIKNQQDFFSILKKNKAANKTLVTILASENFISTESFKNFIAELKEKLEEDSIADFVNQKFYCSFLSFNYYDKKWSEANPFISELMKDCRIGNSVMYFLYTNSKGEVIHKNYFSCYGKDGTNGNFFNSLKESLDSTTQCYTLLKKFEAGERDTGFVKHFFRTLTFSTHDSTDKFVLDFIKSRDNLFTKENADILMHSYSHIVAFDYLYSNQDIWKKVVEENVLKNFYKQEIRKQISETYYNVYNFKMYADDLIRQFDGKYPKYGKEASVKFLFWQWVRLEDGKNPELSYLVKTYIDSNFIAKQSNYDLNSLAWSAFIKVTDTFILNQALFWCKKSLEQDNNNPAYLDTYANILYKLGQTKEAIEIETKVLNGTTDQDEKKSYEETLDKMKKGKPTWK